MTTNAHKRRDMDIMKLMMSDYAVDMEGDGSEFVVAFHGPKDSLYEGGVWKVHVTLPKDYPYRSPSIGFKNRLFHPNVDEMSGSVCLDVINQTWSPMYELVNIFDMFLPQLLAYPNASDPLNSDAAALMIQDFEKYSLKVKEYVRKFAQNLALDDLPSSVKKNRHPSTDSSSTVRSASSSSTIDSAASSATMLEADRMVVDDGSTSARVSVLAQQEEANGLDNDENDEDDDEDDDLSSLSDEDDDDDDNDDDDDDDDLVLDL